MRGVRSATERCEEVAEGQYGLVTRAQALDEGVPPATLNRRLSTRRWRAVRPAVYLVFRHPNSWLQDLMAACLWAGLGSFASHRAAAVVWELRGIQMDVLEIITPSRVRAPDVVVHRLELTRDEITVHRGIPVTTPTRTLLDLAGVVEPHVLEVAFDDALRRGLTHVDLLEQGLRRLSPNHRGLRVLKRLVSERRRSPATESPLEVQVLRWLRRNGLEPPARQHPVRLRDGTLRLDFAWPEHRIALEVEGYAWHSDRQSWERDMARHDLLVDRGWRVMRITKRRLDCEAEAMAQRLRRWLRERR